MSRRWVIGCAAVVAIVCLLAVGGWAFLAWRVEPPRHAPRPFTEGQNRELAQRGQRIVAAIYQFKEDVGLWPHRLDDLAPDHLPEKPEAWVYEWCSWGSWSLTCFGGYPFTALRFRYSEGSGEWETTDGEWNEPLKGGAAEPKPSPADPTRRPERLVSELRRRIIREPRSMLHREALVVRLADQKRFVEARVACEGCAEAFPQEWWPVLALALVDAKAGRWAEAEKRLRAWAEGKGEFGYSFLLAYYYDHTGHHERALETLRSAARLPMRNFHDDHIRMQWHAWRAVDRLSQGGDFEATLALCDRWEEYRKKGSVALDESYCTYRTAALLALGRFDEAETAMKAVRDAGLRIKWADNTAQLDDAIKRRDSGFRYVQGDKPTPFTWEPKYE